MDFEFTEEQEAFRKEVRDFLEEEIRRGSFEPKCDAWLSGYSREFTRKVGERGWIGMTWPKEWGGREHGFIYRLICTEEMLRYGAPAAGHWYNDRQVGLAIIHYGTKEQKREFLPRIKSGEIFFAVGMSEPEAGSDLAGLQTRAVEDGDYYIINGQKTWTGGAHHCDYIYLLARTDPEAPKHRGISEFIVDLKLPGITIEPIIDMSGGHHVNDVFFDGVRVHKSMMVGEKNRGWYQIVVQLDYERSGVERLMSNYPLFQALVAYAKETKRNGQPLSKDPLIRQKLAQLHIEFEVGRLLVYRVAWMMDQELIPTYETAMGKAYCTDFEKRLADAAVHILGLGGQLMPGSKWAPWNGIAAYSHLLVPRYTVQGGTSEVLRNIIALRGLELPAR
jgi:alkylation response protein AidB-like acyl-CoA dehydrogenase